MQGSPISKLPTSMQSRMSIAIVRANIYVSEDDAPPMTQHRQWKDGAGLSLCLPIMGRTTNIYQN